MPTPLITIKGLHVKFALRGQTLHALRGVDLDIFEGESLAIVGESGAGKSVLMKTLNGLLDKNGWVDAGSISFGGLDLATPRSERDWRAIRGRQVAMVMQDPMTSMNPLKTVGWQVLEALKYNRGLRGAVAKALAIQLLADVGIPDPERRYHQYPHELSGGQRQRAVIAMALGCDARLLICDEPTTALDVTIQAQILSLIGALKKRYGLTLVYITHDLGVVANVADRVAVMYAGDIVEIGTCREVFFDPRHPYTWALLSSLPQLGAESGPLAAIRGTPPNLFHPIRGDAFAPRNPRPLAIDFLHRPPYFDVSPTHRTKTWLLDPRAPKIAPPAAIRGLRTMFDGVEVTSHVR